jgi:bifunctional ADP-heptose synthase (sugar kinase/adenylyltransferase)
MTAVDPKLNHFFDYKGIDLFKPNLKEIKEALKINPSKINLSSLKDMHLKLLKELHHSISMVTLSEFGVFVQKENEATIYPAHIRKIADVSGAGDTVIAVASVVYCITKNIELSAQLANLAGGLVCEQVGVVPINKGKLLTEALESLNK